MSSKKLEVVEAKVDGEDSSVEEFLDNLNDIFTEQEIKQIKEFEKMQKAVKNLMKHSKNI